MRHAHKLSHEREDAPKATALKVFAVIGIFAVASSVSAVIEVLRIQTGFRDHQTARLFS
jgi:hypothetical protein